MAHFVNMLEGFHFTAASALPENSVVELGKLVGVTRRPTEAGAEGYAWLTVPLSVYSFPASAAVKDGDAFGLKDGVPTPDEAGAFGVALTAAEAGDEVEVVVLP